MMHRIPLWLLSLCVLAMALVPASLSAQDEDGYDLWLDYETISDPAQLRAYRAALSELVAADGSATLEAAERELIRGLRGLLGREVPVANGVRRDGALIVGTPDQLPVIASLPLAAELRALNDREGYVIRTARVNGKRSTVIAGKSDIGALYGAFHLLRLLQTGQPVGDLAITSQPKIQHRLLNHWDNLDRTVERGYAGFSLWDWHRLPGYIDPRYIDYARANASIGINGTVLTNVNANAVVLTPQYLQKVAALADVFRPYGIKVYLTARFSAPIEIGGLKTADPLDPEVRAWWKQKTDEIYRYVPDFGGFLVKANSEGQPGPQDYKRSHAEGANMLAEALEPHGGVVMWRAFVYSHETPVDRIKQAHDEFKPLDGKFRDNVFVQVKNGPLDFQPREPFHPLFGDMPGTPLMMEFQITQEYLGQATNLVYLAPMWKEVLDAETYAAGSGSTVARVIDGSLHDYPMTGIAGVSNIGTDRNWTGHPIAQANWYAFGRLAWNPALSPEEIAEEWIRMTFSDDPEVVRKLRAIMMASREAAVNYMTPLGLTHLMGTSHHYGPAPWVDAKEVGRADWSPVYYHRADTLGIGFDRTATGSNAVAQYATPVRERWGSRETVPDSLLLWFHRVGWDERLESGRTLWEELVHRYSEGVKAVQQMQETWNSLQGEIDPERFRAVQSLLKIQEKEAKWWRDASLLYFQTFSRRPIPEGYEKPEGTLEYYKSLRFPYAPGI